MLNGTSSRQRVIGPNKSLFEKQLNKDERIVNPRGLFRCFMFEKLRLS